MTRQGPYVSIGICAVVACFWVTPVFAQVSGVVTDVDTGDPIEGALVTLQASTIQTETAADGTYDLAGATGANLVIVAARKGYFYSAITVTSPAAGVDFSLEPVDLDFDITYEFSADFCGFCHSAQVEQWSSSRMGNTGLNQWVYDLYNGMGTAGGMNGFVYTMDGTNVGTDPDGGCAACHQPVRWIANGGEVPLSTDFVSPGIPLEMNILQDEQAIQGVTCDVCHKMADVDTAFVNTLGLDPAAITMNLPGPGPLPPQIQYGVLGDVSFEDVNFMRGSYQPQLTNDTCAACHQYFSDIDQDGQQDDFPGQTTWSDWVNSPYGDPQSPMFATCIDCHTQGFGASQACDIVILDRDPNTVHEMNFKGTDADHLENAAIMDMVVNMVGDTAEVQVDVTNAFAGHNLPTGVSIRNVILLVDAIRQEDGLRLTETLGQVIHPLGGVGDPAQGYYADLPGKVYGRINEDADGN